MLRGLVTAIRTLTIFPVPGKDAEHLSASLPWFPVVGLLLGGMLYGIAVLPGFLFGTVWPEGMAVAIIACSVFITRGMHLDGLADCADGFGSRGDRAKFLAIMKDPHVGVFGVIAIVVTLLIKFAAITPIVAAGSPVVIAAAYIISRTMLAELAVVLPYARAEGGTAGPFVNGARQWHRIVALVSSVIFLCAISGLVAGFIVFAAAWSITRLFGWWCKRTVGGVTGDLLGACSEIVETMVLFSGAGVWNAVTSLNGLLAG
jgi:adenosylcobinamide-GDP ribazoletransferase